MNLSDSLPFTTYDQQPIAPVWRPVVASIVSALAHRDFELLSADPAVVRPSADVAQTMGRSITECGADSIVELPVVSWSTSVAIWCDTYWEALVDLWTAEGQSDLVLHLDLRSVGPSRPLPIAERLATHRRVHFAVSRMP